MTIQTCARAVIRASLLVLCALWIACRQPPATTSVAETVPDDPNRYEIWEGAGTGTLAGVATLDVPPALRERMRATPHPQEAGHQIPAGAMRASGLNGTLADVVVYLADIRRGRAFDARPTNALLNQRAMQFEPRIQLVPPGTDLEIRNSDPESHNVRGVLAETRETVFNYAMPLQDQRLHVALDRPGQVNVMCDMKHGWMKATLVVMRHPYYAMTDANGRFELTRVPPGEYSLRAWHDTFGEQTLRVRVRAADVTQVTFAFSVS